MITVPFERGDTLHHICGAVGIAASSGSINSMGVPIVSVRECSWLIPWQVEGIAAVVRGDVVIWERATAQAQLALFDEDDPYWSET